MTASVGTPYRIYCDRMCEFGHVVATSALDAARTQCQPSAFQERDWVVEQCSETGFRLHYTRTVDGVDERCSIIALVFPDAQWPAPAGPAPAMPTADQPRLFAPEPAPAPA